MRESSRFAIVARLVRCVAFAGLVLSTPLLAGEPKPLVHAHAHNDYAHDRPLLDALDHGFCSVEADIYLVNKNLMVGHSPFELRAGRTLEALYLDPLLERVQANGGRVYKNGPPFVLLVDFKSKGGPTYERLREVLPKYADMLSHMKDGKWVEGAVTIVISGDRPIDAIEADNERMVGIDGRPGDLNSDSPANLIPMISDSWGSQFTWKGDGEMPKDQREKLHRMCEEVHQQGRILRFWATPEKRSVWDVLSEEGVDLLNTDDLPGMQAYLSDRKS